MINGKTVLITGGTGSFGKKFVEIVLKRFKPKKIIIFSRDEQKQFQMEQNIKSPKSSRLRFFIGDVRDFDRLKFATKSVDFVIHAAALKHVPIAEYNPFEVVKTNVLGAQNVIDACVYNNVKKVIALSTDKASSPVNLYGASKLTSDKLFIAANNFVGKDLRFSVVRYGNVMGSNGSVIPIFIKMKDKGFFEITDKRMTRFNITLEESVNFVLLSLSKMLGGEIYVPKIPSYNITDVAKAIDTKSKIKIIGIRPGEKIHEEMISKNESINSLEFDKYFVILPDTKFGKINKKIYLKKFKNAKLCKPGFQYNSKENKKFLKIKELQKLISKQISK